MKRSLTYLIAFNAVIAALYAVPTIMLAPFGYGMVQIRFAEALTILPSLVPSSWIGITLGCAIANIVSPYGFIDILLGTAATFIAAIITSKIRNPFIAAIPPVLVNAICLPFIWWIFAGDLAYWFNFASILISQGLVLYLLGVPLFYLMRNRVLPKLNLPDGLTPSY